MEIVGIFLRNGNWLMLWNASGKVFREFCRPLGEMQSHRCCVVYKAICNGELETNLTGHEISLIVYFVMSCLCLVSHSKKERSGDGETCLHK
jgi:hypothetical protein